jgi:hypothetical protein
MDSHHQVIPAIDYYFKHRIKQMFNTHVISVMASRYIRLSCYGSNVDPRDDDDEISAAVALSLVPRKRKWGGSVPGHRVYKRDRAGADKRLMADYFVPRPLYNEDHFRRR